MLKNLLKVWWSQKWHFCILTPDDSKYKSKLLIIKLITNITYKYKDRNDVIIIHLIQLNRDTKQYLYS